MLDVEKIIKNIKNEPFILLILEILNSQPEKKLLKDELFIEINKQFKISLSYLDSYLKIMVLLDLIELKRDLMSRKENIGSSPKSVILIRNIDFLLKKKE